MVESTRPAPSPATARSTAPARSTATWVTVSVLIAIAVIGTLWVPIYARSAPKLGPFPFFYWYQLIWVPIDCLLCSVCCLLLRDRPGRVPGGDAGGRP
jgi:Protein of unknown function (DUF3311)